MTRRRFLALTAASITLNSAPSIVSGQQAPRLEPVRIATGLRSGLESLSWIAAEAGIFKRLGFEPTVKLETGGPECVAGLVRGDWEFGETGSAPFVQSVLDEHDTVILLAAMEPLTTGIPILMRSSMSGQPAELGGKRIGVLTETGQVAIVVRAALRMWGVEATLVPLETFGKTYAALAAGQIDAGALAVDYRFLGPREHGFKVIDTPGTGFVPAAVGCTRRLITTRRDLVGQVVQGYVEAIHFFKTKRADVVPLLQQFLGFTDRAAVEDAYEYYATRFQSLPRLSAVGIDKLAKELARRQPSAASLSLAAVSDMSFLDELARSGFVRALYSR
jgi:ABC-type nitrate/sulfonate/bicarbonate transport system substrate-binding protein